MLAAKQVGLRRLLSDIGTFSRLIWSAFALRGYQLGPARAVVAAVRGDVPQREFVLIFSRQSGKDELLAQVLAYLLVLYQKTGGSIVVTLPTLRPQAVIARDRIVERLNAPRLQALGVRARVRDGFIVEVGKASVHFLSGAPTANACGKTASLLLVGNESQDIEADRWDAVGAPMGGQYGRGRAVAGNALDGRHAAFSATAALLSHWRLLTANGGPMWCRGGRLQTSCHPTAGTSSDRWRNLGWNIRSSGPSTN